MGYDIIIGRDKYDKKLFGKKGLIYLGKGYVKMGNYTSISNKIWLDVARTHVILIAGKRGGGKCLSGDTLISLSDGSKKTIKSLKNNRKEILSLNKKNKIESVKMSEFFSRKVNKLLKIKLRSGKEIKLTPEHPLLTIKGWKLAEKLKLGSRIATPKIKKSFNTSDIFWDEIVSMELLEGNFKVYDICVPENHNFIANDIIVHNSYSIGVIAEELSDLPEEARKSIASLIFDTMGIFWTMKFKNDKEIELLDEWNLKTKNLPVVVWVPSGYYEEFEKREIPVDRKFALAVSELNIEDWLSIFDLKMTSQISVLIQKVISKLIESEVFDLDDIINGIKDDPESNDDTKKSAISLFEAAKSWKIFAKKDEIPTKVEELIAPGITTVLDLSVYSSTSVFNVRGLVIGLISRKLFDQRMLARKKEEIESIHHGLNPSYEEKKEIPLVWMFLDEAHEFLPMEGTTPATNALVQLLREGRQPGISMVLATQQPGVIHRDVMTQSDIVLSHRVTNKEDLEALNRIMQSYLIEGITKTMNDLPDAKGSAILLDDNSERIYPIKVRPRFTWHGGEAPKAVKVEEQEE